jgi:hypothetical protein
MVKPRLSICKQRAASPFFPTIGKKSKDRDAVKAIMEWGDDTNDMDRFYDEEPVDDERLKAVTDFVRACLFSRK